MHILTRTCASRHNRVHFSTTPKLLREWCAFNILISKHASRWLRTRRLSEPTFRPSGAPKYWQKNTVFCYFSTFTRTCIFFLLTLSLSFSFLIFFLLAVSSLTLPTSAFSFVHIVGSLTSKLPSESVLWKTITFNRYCNSVCELGHLRQFADCPIGLTEGRGLGQPNRHLDPMGCYGMLWA